MGSDWEKELNSQISLTELVEAKIHHPTGIWSWFFLARQGLCGKQLYYQNGSCLHGTLHLSTVEEKIVSSVHPIQTGTEQQALVNFLELSGVRWV